MSLGVRFILVAAAALGSAGLALGSGYGLARTTLPVTAPEMVDIGPGMFSYRLSGEFTRNGRPVAPPTVTARIGETLTIMRSQVMASDYERCVEARACPVAEPDAAAPDLPMVKTNWQDATAYAAWLSRETGKYWRLPTDKEWAYAAASLFNDDILPESFNGSDPGRRALALYDRDTSRADGTGKALRPIGGFGKNENGLLDVAGNVWEWTDTCFARHALGERGEIGSTVFNCGVRVVEGRHRTYMTDFIRDPRIGGCVAGLPPANLGFRLVRDEGPWRRLRSLSAQIRRLVGMRA
jgi:formylglycine-generating enzyme required for sulfatase activity